MSSDNTRDPKRSGLAGQIEVEVIRDPQSTGMNNLLASSSSSNPQIPMEPASIPSRCFTPASCFLISSRPLASSRATGLREAMQ